MPAPIKPRETWVQSLSAVNAQPGSERLWWLDLVLLGLPLFWKNWDSVLSRWFAICCIQMQKAFLRPNRGPYALLVHINTSRMASSPWTTSPSYLQVSQMLQSQTSLLSQSINLGVQVMEVNPGPMSEWLRDTDATKSWTIRHEGISEKEQH